MSSSVLLSVRLQHMRIVRHTAFATAPDQRCTAALSLALHRIRDT